MRDLKTAACTPYVTCPSSLVTRPMNTATCNVRPTFPPSVNATETGEESCRQSPRSWTGSGLRRGRQGVGPNHNRGKCTIINLHFVPGRTRYLTRETEDRSFLMQGAGVLATVCGGERPLLTARQRPWPDIEVDFELGAPVSPLHDSVRLLISTEEELSSSTPLRLIWANHTPSASQTVSRRRLFHVSITRMLCIQSLAVQYRWYVNIIPVDGGQCAHPRL